MRNSPSGGFTFIEFLIILAFVMILVGMAVPAVGSIQDDSRTSELLGVVEELGKGCADHYRDTGELASEFSAAKGGHSYTQPRYHQLSMKQATRGWQGPYVSRPISRADNPFGGAVYLHEHLAASPAHGFDLDGTGEADDAGAGQYVVFYNVPRRIAESIDAALDKRVPNASGEGWMSTGRVEWTETGGGAVMIHLMSR